MSDTKPSYALDFAKIYAIVALGVGGVLFLLAQLEVSLENAIIRGAVIGGVIGSMMWPVQAFCRNFKAENDRTTAGLEAWKFTFLFAGLALVIHILVSVVAFALGWQIPGILAQDQGELVGIVLAIVFMLQVPMFRIFQWAAFRGIAKQEERNSA